LFRLLFSPLKSNPIPSVVLFTLDGLGLKLLGKDFTVIVCLLSLANYEGTIEVPSVNYTWPWDGTFSIPISKALLRSPSHSFELKLELGKSIFLLPVVWVMGDRIGTW